MLSCPFNDINGSEHKNIATIECRNYIFQRVSAISNSPSGTSNLVKAMIMLNKINWNDNHMSKDKYPYFEIYIF